MITVDELLGGSGADAMTRLADVGPDERRALIEPLKRELDHCGEFIEIRKDSFGARNPKRYAVAAAAMLIVANPSELKHLVDSVKMAELRVALLSRTRADRQRIAEHCLGNASTWHVVRELVAAGELDRPAHQDYLLCWHRWAFRRAPLANHLRETPDVFDDIWELLAIEGGGETSFAAHDKFSRDGERWDDALHTLAGEGLLSRLRLLDLTLDVLGRDFAAFRAQWYSALHEKLTPTLDERADRQARYARLANSTVPATVSFAVRALSTVDKAGRLDDDVMLPHLAAAAANRTAGTVKLAMRLAANVHKRRSDLTAEVVAVFEAASQHQNTDVRTTAEKALAGLGQAVAAAPVVQVAAREYPEPADLAPLDRLVLEGRPRLEIPRTPGEFAEAMAAAIEDDGDADGVEALLTGAAMLAPSGELPAAVTPLVRRAERKWLEWSDMVSGELLLLIRGLAGEVRPEVERAYESGWLGALRSRVRGILTGKPQSLVACANHTGGWLDPRAFVIDLVDGPVPVEYQLVAGLLRLAPDHRPEALTMASELPGTTGEAVRFALGGPRPEGPVTQVGLAAARARRPDANDPLAVLEGRDSEAFTWSIAIEDRVPKVTLGPLVKPEGRWLGTLFNREGKWLDVLSHRLISSPYDVALDELDRAVAWLHPYAEKPVGTELHALWRYLSEPAGPAARIMIVAALNSAHPILNQLAVDVVVQSLNGGLLGPRALGDALATLAPVLVLTRIATVLTTVAQEHPSAVLSLLDTLLPRLDRGQRGLFALLELAADLSDRGAGRLGSDATAWLAGITGSSKAATAASRLR